MTGSDIDWTLIDHDRAAAHRARGELRYSICLRLAGGGFIRRWTEDRNEALAHHANAVADPNMEAVITFDHLGIDSLAADVAVHGKTAALLKAEDEEAIDQMIDRYLADRVP